MKYEKKYKKEKSNASSDRSEIVSYIVCGILTTIVGMAVYFGLTGTVLNPQNAIELQIANVIMWVVAVTFAFFVNRRVVFKSKCKYVLKEAVLFYCARLGTLLLEMIVMFICVTKNRLDDRISKIFVQGLVMVCNYVFSKWMVFGKEHDEEKY